MKRRQAINGLMATTMMYHSTFFEARSSRISGYIKNPKCIDLISEDIWPGTPIDESRNFVNHEFPMTHSFYDVIRWKLSPKPFKQIKKTEKYSYPVLEDANFLSDERDMIVWLGHASFFLRLGGKKLLIDPIFDAPLAMKRKTKMPVKAVEFMDIDYILVSHDHRDHMDKSTCKVLNKNNPSARWITGLNMKPLLKKWLGNIEIHEAGWFQKYVLNDPIIDISFVPSRHWSKRTLSDTNSRLWGGFVIQYNGINIYFGGDSGKGNHFKMVSELFGKIDYFLVGIGAFEPRWFMAQNHMSPKDAVEISKDIHPENIITMHHSTFDLSDEPLGEPVRQFEKYMTDYNLLTNYIKKPIGAPIHLDNLSG